MGGHILTSVLYTVVDLSHRHNLPLNHGLHSAKGNLVQEPLVQAQTTPPLSPGETSCRLQVAVWLGHISQPGQYHSSVETSLVLLSGLLLSSIGRQLHLVYIQIPSPE